MKVAYLVDSSSCMKENPANDLYVLPLSIIVNQNGQVHQYNDDGEQFPLEKLVELQDHASITTSQPSIAQIEKKIAELSQKYDLIIAIPISSGLSKCYEAFCLIQNKYPQKLLILDCMTLQAGIQWLVEDLQAYIKAHPQFSRDEIVQICQANRQRGTGIIAVNNCTQLIRGGRLSAYKGFIVKLMGIHILIQLNPNIDGKLAYAGKCFSNEHGALKSLELLDQLLNFRQKGIDKVAHFTTFVDPNKTEKMYQIYRQKTEEFCGYRGEVLRTRICSTVAIHTGVDTYTIYIRTK